MNNQQLLDELHFLGIDPDSYAVLAMLPLIQVAWADGEVQPPEQELILRVARSQGLLEGASGTILQRWLSRAPSAEQIQRGRTLLVALSHRQQGLGSALDAGTLRDVQSLCVQVARSAGGVFDLLFTVDPSEQAAIDEIGQEMNHQTNDFLDDLPSPDGGDWVELGTGEDP